MKASPIRCLVSAGPTREFFDPVRYVTNPSSGKMGYALAASARRRGWQTTLVSGPVALPAPEGVERIPVVTAAEMLTALQAQFEACDVLIMTAAIVDFRPRSRSTRKVKKHELSMQIEMEPVPDLLATLTQGRRDDQVIVAFAAETDHVEAYAQRKLVQKRADFVVANQVGGANSAFESDTNTVLLLRHDAPALGLGPSPKTVLAEALITQFADCLEARQGRPRPLEPAS